MSTEVTLFTNQMPAYLAEIGTEEGNIVGRESIPQLSFRGKVWRVIIDGEETICVKDDGEPLQVVPVVILDYNKKRSRAFFPGGFEEGKTSRPTCWSRDGVTPDAKVTEKQHHICEGCPQSIKGSKVSDAGKELTACGQFKNAVVVAPTLVSGWKPLLLKLPQTSIWDKDAAEYEAKRFYAFDNYMDMLKRSGVNHTARVVTKLKFDPRMAYPKVFFGPADWLPGDVAVQVKDLLDDKETIAKLLNIDLTAETIGVEAKGNGVDTRPSILTPEVEKIAADLARQSAARAATTAPKAPVAPKAPPKPVAPVVDPDEVPPLTMAAAPKPSPAAIKAAKTTAVTATPVATVPPEAVKGPGLSTLLTAWDDTE